MPYRTGKLVYKNKSTMKEFVTKFFQSLGAKKAMKAKKDLENTPEYKAIQKRLEKAEKELAQRLQKQRKNNPKLDSRLKALGL